MMPNTEKFLDKVFEEKFATVDTFPDSEPFGVIRFSGWKEIPNSISLVGFIVWYPPLSHQKEEAYLITLPGMKAQVFNPRGTFNIESVDGAPTALPGWDVIGKQTPEKRERVRNLVREAFVKLIDFVIAHNPQWLETALANLDVKVGTQEPVGVVVQDGGAAPKV